MTRKNMLVVFITLLAIVAIAAMPIMVGCSEPAAETTTPEPTATATTEPEPEETYTLRYIAGTPGNVESSVPGRAAIDWAAKVEEMSGGRLTIQLLNGAAPDPELYDIIAQGGGDLAQNPIMFNSGRFPILEAMTLPDMGTADRHPSQACYDLVQAYPEIDEDEFAEVKLISVYCATQAPPGISFCTGDTPVYSIDDFQGMKIGTYGNWSTKVMTACGASVVAVTPSEVYEAMQRKIVDGSCLDPEILEANLVYEVAKYWHQLNFQFVPFFFACNIDTWNSLPSDLQDIMMEAGSEIPGQIDSDFRDSTVRALNDAVDIYGMEVIEYSDEELARWQEAQEPVQQEYMDILNEKGYDGAEIFETIKNLHAKYAEW